MANKVVLPVRLDPSLIARLRELSTAIHLPVDEVICVALDALEREQGEVGIVTERVAGLEKNLLGLVDLMGVFNEKMDQAGVVEKDRLRAVYQGLEGKMNEHGRKILEQGETFNSHVSVSAESWRRAAVEAQKAADGLNRAGGRRGWWHYGLVVSTGLITAVLVSVFWLKLAPPTVKNELDPQAVAQCLKPAVIAALRPSRGN